MIAEIQGIAFEHLEIVLAKCTNEIDAYMQNNLSKLFQSILVATTPEK